MNDREGYGFCPKCGALMQDGVCRSCNYTMRTESQAGTGWPGAAGGWNEPSLRPVKKPKKRSGNGKVLAVIFGGIGILFIVAIVLSMVYSIRKVVNEVQRGTIPGYGYDDNGYFGYGNPYSDDGYDDYDDSYEYYEPSENDDYYKEITDATSQDLDYKVIWGTLSLRPDDSDNACTYECVYPVLTGEGEEEKFSGMNRAVEDLVCRYKNGYQEYEGGVTSYGYVTYMDEEKISIVVRHSLSEKKTTIPRVEAISLRVDSGEVISHEEMVPVDEELIWQFRSRNSYQNGTVEFVDELSDEELMEYLTDQENSVMFYTPVGLEIGFNYDGGWVTVTLKTNTL